MNDEDLKKLSQLQVPEASVAARRRALAASLAAFDDATAETENISPSPTQGLIWRERLTSIVANVKRVWTMDTRVSMTAAGVTTAALLLLLLPLGYQLFSSTALTPPGVSNAVAPGKEGGLISPPAPTQPQNLEKTAPPAEI